MYRDRTEAGRELAEVLVEEAPQHPVVLGLPRGGVPVAFEVAGALDAPLDIFMVRKVGAPDRPELALAAVASGGIVARNAAGPQALFVDEPRLEQAIRDEMQALVRQETLLRQNGPPAVRGKDVIVVDDGLATGATMEAAVTALRQKEPASITVAAPVGSPASCERLARIADRVVCPLQPPEFAAVGQWYRRFDQTSNEEVRTLLRRASERG